MLPNDIHHTFLVVDKDGKKSHHPAGRFMIHDGSVHHLEDYYGHLRDHVPEGPIDNFTIASLGSPPAHFTHASHTGLRGGHHPHLIPEADLQPMPEPQTVAPEQIQQHVLQPPPSVWHYHRAGHDQPHVLEAKAGKFMLDGNPLEHHEVATILDNVRTRAGKIRYVKGGAQTAISKMEKVFENLRKEEPMDSATAFKHLHAAAQAGHIPHDAVDSLRRQIYTDPMTPTIGNKYAFNEFSGKGKPGVYVSMDGNDFKAINDVHGHQAGDAAIRAFGGAAREAMDEAVGSKQAKLFRNADEQNLYRSGGDEFVAHVPTHAHATAFARALRSKLEAMPPINGSHKLSMSFGFGNDYGTADKALAMAKEQKYAEPASLPGSPRARKFAVGQAPSLAHSLVPNFEGAVPLNENQLQVTAPKIEQRAEAPLPSAPTAHAPTAPKLA